MNDETVTLSQEGGMMRRIKRIGRIIWLSTIAVTSTVGTLVLLAVAVVFFNPSLLPFAPGGSITFDLADHPSLEQTFEPAVGETVPFTTGVLLDGSADNLSAYRGRVVLIDFWATWCKPCVAALPELRELVAELPADRFTLLAISVDIEIEDVTRFMEDEPMPWVNWYTGMAGGSIMHAWGVNTFPTYILLDAQGRILERTSGLSPSLVSAIREALDEA